MRQTRLLMGMPVTVDIVGEDSPVPFDHIYDYFASVDARYSPYKPDSELSRVNAGLPEADWSPEFRDILARCEQTKRQTHGYFDIQRADGHRDPSGLVKGWAIAQAADQLRAAGYQHFFIEAGGDIQPSGFSPAGASWRVGVRNPFDRDQVVKVLAVTTEGVATSGTAVRGQHIYNPHEPGRPLTDIVSLTVIGPNIYDADRFATAAFAMGRWGLKFIESLRGFEAYLIDSSQHATWTAGFERYVI